VKTRRKFIIAGGAGLCLLAAPMASIAQQQGKVWRVGYLSRRAGEARDKVFLTSLRELGYVEGQNIVIEWRFAKGKADLLPELAADLVRLKVDCIVANGTIASHAAKKATSTIPIVMGNSDDDPVRQGLVASLARPGGNITGFSNISADLAGKRLQLLKETLPKASRVAMIWDPDSRPAMGYVRETEVAARALGVQLQSLEVRDPEELENAFRAAGKGSAEALIVVGTGVLANDPARIVNLAIKARLPAIYNGPSWTLAGGLMSYGSNSADQYRHVATYVDKILKGVKPSDLPIEQPMKFELVINLKAAKQIGLTIPPNMLARADKVIE